MSFVILIYIEKLFMGIETFNEAYFFIESFGNFI